MDRAVKAEDWGNWSDAFRGVVDDMSTQFMEMRKVRKRLFAFDGEDVAGRGCEIDVESERMDRRLC